MISVRTTNYAVPPRGHYWMWSSGHDAIEWEDGRTLALWPEIHTILDFLGSNSGVPPLGAVLLVLAACRDEWISHRPRNHAAFRKILAIRENDALPPDYAEILITGLDVIHDLPGDLRASLAAKCHLVSALFEGGPFCLPKSESELVLRDLSVFGIGDIGQRKPSMDAKGRLRRDVRALKTGLARHSAESLENILRTGIENTTLHELELPSPAEDTIEPRLLLDHLVSTSGESGAAAAVAKQAIAMMNFPGRFGAPLDLPVGGIADITNRGTIDRLLPGELAWDDLILAARLVHNEALYFRREIPPQHVAVSHTVLLDRGLRLWGTARVFSLGVTLGLWHHPKLNGPGETFECVAAERDGFAYLDLATTTGVRAALEVLVPAASPETFLTSWWDAAQIVDDPAIPDVSFVTVREHLDDAATRKLLGEIAGWIHERAGRLRVIAIDRLGNLEVQAWSPGGNHTLFHGVIDLADILKPTSPASPPKKPGPPPLRAQPNPLHALLPVYAGEQLPFLFPSIPQASAYLPDGDGASGQHGGIGVSLDHRLMRWPKPGWGATEVVPGKLPGRQHWLGRGADEELVVIASAEQAGGNVRVFRLRDRQLEEIEIEASRHAFPRHAAVSGGDAVVLAYADHVEAFSLKSGRRLAEDSVAKLPANPVVFFDGEKIRVFDSGKKPSLGLDGWSLRDGTWPRLISPDHVSIEHGVLRIMCGNTLYQFNPLKMSWSETKASPARFSAFAESNHSPAPGCTLRVTTVGHLEVWHDSRGLLHLRLKDTLEPNQCWSILLSSPAVSCWIPTHGLDSMDPRLVPPNTEKAQGWSTGLLQAFLSSASAIRL